MRTGGKWVVLHTYIFDGPVCACLRPIAVENSFVLHMLFGEFRNLLPHNTRIYISEGTRFAHNCVSGFEYEITDKKKTTSILNAYLKLYLFNLIPPKWTTAQTEQNCKTPKQHISLKKKKYNINFSSAGCSTQLERILQYLLKNAFILSNCENESEA